jgi:NAD(P)-dependent dehydrogenase (short-subunit alcohol dehydrogenase family)
VSAFLVTGASSGIGRATALRLDRAGHRVLASVRRDEDGEALAAAASDRLEPVPLDVTDGASIAALAERVDSDRAGAGLDGLVNNAGTAIAGPLEMIPIDDFREQLEINLVGQVAVTQALLAPLRRARGRVVFVSSIGGRLAVPFNGPYHASKWAIEAIGDSLRGELRRWGMAVSLIEPGSVATPIWGKGEARADELLDALGPEAERLYGKSIAGFRAQVRATAARGIDPDEVAAVIEMALTAARPRTRYLVGRDAKIQARLRRLVPDRLFDRWVASQMRAGR